MLLWVRPKQPRQVSRKKGTHGKALVLWARLSQSLHPKLSLHLCIRSFLKRNSTSAISSALKPLMAPQGLEPTYILGVCDLWRCCRGSQKPRVPNIRHAHSSGVSYVVSSDSREKPPSHGLKSTVLIGIQGPPQAGPSLDSWSQHLPLLMPLPTLPHSQTWDSA